MAHFVWRTPNWKANYSTRHEQALARELEAAREVILEALGRGLGESISESRWSVRTPQDMKEWVAQTAAMVIAHADPCITNALNFSRRAVCPLCQGSASSVLDGQGFAYPTGLEWHLTGSMAARQCNVFAQIQALVESGAREEAHRAAGRARNTV